MGDIQQYFSGIKRQVENCYRVAREARSRGFDPKREVEIPTANDFADRVEELVGPAGIADRIRTYLKNMSREETAISVAVEIAEEMAGSTEKTVDQAVRTGLAILTEGVLVAPIEGISEVKIAKNFDGSNYVDLYFAGPIRSAGGTGEAMSVLIADIVRRKLGIDRYKPTEDEIERYKEEVPLYDRIATLQYAPSLEEIENIVGNCPICINGEATEDREIMGKRDLPRVRTNKVRGGACLVISEGLSLKAPKILKHVNKMKLEGWDFLKAFLHEEGEEKNEIVPSWKYIESLIAGRPVFSHPSSKGGFRLRYGRGRTCGLASTAINPAAMYILDNFIAIGTQIKTERPGKGTVGTPCDSIEGPMVLLKNGDFMQVNALEEAKKIKDRVKEIIDLGEILISFGEFVENNAILPQASYCYEWWIQELQEKLGCLNEDEEGEKKAEVIVSNELGHKVNLKELSPADAFRISEKFDVPLYPSYNLFWHDISPDEIKLLADAIEKAGFDEFLAISKDKKIKEILLKLGALHRERETIIIEKYAYPLIRCCGFDVEDGKIGRKRGVDQLFSLGDPMKMVSELSGIKIMPRAPQRIGTRMGRPEKAAERTMRASPHVLFPVSEAGGRERLVNSALRANKIRFEAGARKCERCKKITYKTRCDCGGLTSYTGKIDTHEVKLYMEIERAKKNIGMISIPEKVKGVIGLSSKNKTPECIEKGLLRAKHGVYVFKDGTARFDMTNMPLTHFRPDEIDTSVEKLHALGYDKDWKGKPLERKDQICELKIQDVVPSKKCATYMLKVANYIDELLDKFYGIEPFYNASDMQDLIGSMVVGLSPHTSAGAVGRIIGFIDADVCCAHPFYHAAKRRNCDGDEDTLMLLLDVLINFSLEYIPEKRGGHMDLPLVLATKISPSEIDKEAQSMDLLRLYPLEFYRATIRHAHPKELEKKMDLVAYRIGTGREYSDFSFTHDTRNISEGTKTSSYKTLKKMEDKLDAQLELARKIRAVDENDVATRVIQTHFLPDLIGNLRAFTTQQVRCVKCNKKYRRIPLRGVCTKCGGSLTLTVHEKSIKKYLEPAKKIMNGLSIPEYTKQRILIFEKSAESLFKNDKIRKTKLSDFFK
ncbi:MAG: DNA polymerase II large subunit [Candidatus Thermoplasmatota archaeon]|nr:DNA polymerase II large subunit [Candidatus Thermoplasmatota archaeon]